MKTIKLKHLNNKNINDKEINLSNLNFIYGVNGTGKSTTANSYMNRKEGMVFSNEYVNQNLFIPSSINGEMSKEQSDKFTHIMFGSEIVEPSKMLEKIKLLKNNLDSEKNSLLAQNFDKLKLINFGIKDEYIDNNNDLKAKNLFDETGEIEYKISEITSFWDKEKLEFNDSKIKSFLEVKSNVKFKDDLNLVELFSIRKVQENNCSINTYNEILSKHVKVVSEEFEKISNNVDNFNLELSKYEKVDKSINIKENYFPKFKWALENSKKRCIVCENEKFNEHCERYVKIKDIIESKYSKLRAEIEKSNKQIIESIKSIYLAIEVIKDENLIDQEILNKYEEDIKLLNNESDKICKIINDKNDLTSFKVDSRLEKILEVKLDPIKIHKNIVVEIFREEYICYNSILLKIKLLNNYSKMIKDNLKSIDLNQNTKLDNLREILRDLGFSYEVRVESVSRSISELGINHQILKIDNRGVEELSSGERNTLALAFFYANVFERGDDLKWVIVDDPIDSNDSGKVAKYIDMLWKRYKTPGFPMIKTILFTHNSEFLFTLLKTSAGQLDKWTVINIHHDKEPSIIFGKNEIESFLRSDGEFIRSTIEDFIKNQDDKEKFIKAFSVLSKFVDIVSELYGINVNKQKYKSIHNDSVIFTVHDFLEVYNQISIGNDIEIKSNLEIRYNDIDNFINELNDWKPRDNYIDDLNEIMLRKIAYSSYSKEVREISKTGGTTNDKVIRHSGSIFKPILHFSDFNM